MKILAIPASNSRTSINRQVLKFAADLIEGGLIADATVEFVDLNDYEMPIFSIERQQADGVPEPAQRLFEMLGDADAILLAYAEHNGSYTVAWKNVYDWMSRIDMAIYQGAKVAMFATTPGRRGGASVLRTATASAQFAGAELVGSLGIGSFGDVFDTEAGEIIDPDLRAEFIKIVAALG